MTQNYYFIDGSALIAQIRELRKTIKSLRNRKLDPVKLIRHFSVYLTELGSDEYKRVIIYFPNGETTVEDYIVVPNFKKPGLIRDLHFKYCGQKIKGSEAFNKFVSEKVPKKWKNRFTKSEKGVDIEMCCDAIKLASTGKMERLFLFTNDDDFLPLCKILKDFGTNISLLHLSEFITPNRSLIKETDSYDVISETNLQTIFVPPLVPAAATQTVSGSDQESN